MALSKETHIKLGGRFLSLPRFMALSNRANHISKPLSLKYLHLSCYRKKNTLMSFHVSVFHITSR